MTPKVRHTEGQLAEHFDQSLATIGDLCGLYDGGRPYIAFTLATEVFRLLTSNRYSVERRGAVRFPTVFRPEDPAELAVEAKLIALRVSDPPMADFLPFFWRENADRIMFLDFREWWNRDVIHRASCAPVGRPQCEIFIDEAARVPYEKRSKLTRRTFVEQMRNKLGAHLDEEIPEHLDALQKAHVFGLEFIAGDGPDAPRLSDGSLPMGIGPAAAMMRQISHEVLVAFGTEARLVIPPVTAGIASQVEK